MKHDSIPQHVLEALHGRGHTQESVEHLDAESVFREFCEWHGLIRWGGTLWNYAHKLKAIEDADNKGRKIA